MTSGLLLASSNTVELKVQWLQSLWNSCDALQFKIQPQRYSAIQFIISCNICAQSQKGRHSFLLRKCNEEEYRDKRHCKFLDIDVDLCPTSCIVCSWSTLANLYNNTVQLTVNGTIQYHSTMCWNVKRIGNYIWNYIAFVSNFYVQSMHKYVCVSQTVPVPTSMRSLKLLHLCLPWAPLVLVRPSS